MSTFVPDKLTPLTRADAIAATCTAFMRELKMTPSPESLAILVSHTALECGQWKSLHCFNLGNVKGEDPATGLFTQYKCDERYPAAKAEQLIASAGKRHDGGPAAELRSKNPDGTWTIWFYPPHAQCTFRAFLTAEDAFRDYIQFLFTDTTPNNGRPNKWHRAAAACIRGDLKSFVYDLYDPDGNRKTADGYFTANPDIYYDGGDGSGGKPGILAIYEQFLPLCEAHVRSLAPAGDDGDNGDHVAAVFAKLDAAEFQIRASNLDAAQAEIQGARQELSQVRV